MSFLDLHFLRRLRESRTWEGLRPPSTTFRAIRDELRWCSALYQEDALPYRERAVFLGLRVVQRLAYNAGWVMGGRS